MSWQTIVYFGLALWAVVWAAKSGRALRDKIIAGVLMFALWAAFPAWVLYTAYQEQREAHLKQHETQMTRAEGQARLDELCKNAGVFVHREVEPVDGLFLMKLRPTGYVATNKWAVDPLGYAGDTWDRENPISESYVQEFLSAFNEKGFYIGQLEGPQPGYRYVDLIDPRDGVRYRYTAYMAIPKSWQGRADFKEEYRQFTLRREPVTPDMALPRYGVTFDDITEHADRDRWWIAGSLLQVIDLESNEPVLERIAYVMDWRRGRGGSLSNWDRIRSYSPYCPFRVDSSTHIFIRTHIKPRSEPQ